MESVVQQMQDSNTGIPIKTVSTFMYKIPSVFSGGQTNKTSYVCWSDDWQIFVCRLGLRFMAAVQLAVPTGGGGGPPGQVSTSCCAVLCCTVLLSLLCSHGYIFPIDDHIMTVKNDNNTLYRQITEVHCYLH